MITIEFEDCGQDFTHWTCDESGKVVNCTPFQAWLWNGMEVLGAHDLKRGDVVDYIDREGHVRTLKYRVASVTP